MRRMLSVLRRAIEDYNMIDENDNIAVGLSGGKDSLSLLAALAALKKFYPLPFGLCAITLDLGFKGADFSPLEKFCSGLGIPFHLIPTSVYEVVFEERKEKNPCSLCANMRRGALNSAAKERGCNKVALGHHFDDVVETFLMSLTYEGRLYSFSPVTYLDRADITVIRPLIYTPENELVSFAKRHALPVFDKCCPADGFTKRQEIKLLLKSLEEKNADVKEKIFGAICRSGVGGFKEPQTGIKRPFVRRNPPKE